MASSSSSKAAHLLAKQLHCISAAVAELEIVHADLNAARVETSQLRDAVSRADAQSGRYKRDIVDAHALLSTTLRAHDARISKLRENASNTSAADAAACSRRDDEIAACSARIRVLESELGAMRVAADVAAVRAADALNARDASAHEATVRASRELDGLARAADAQIIAAHKQVEALREENAALRELVEQGAMDVQALRGDVANAELATRRATCDAVAASAAADAAEDVAAALLRRGGRRVSLSRSSVADEAAATVSAATTSRRASLSATSSRSGWARDLSSTTRYDVRSTSPTAPPRLYPRGAQAGAVKSQYSASSSSAMQNSIDQRAVPTPRNESSGDWTASAVPAARLGEPATTVPPWVRDARRSTTLDAALATARNTRRFSEELSAWRVRDASN